MIEVIRNIYEDGSDGAFVGVSPKPDCPTRILLSVDSKSEDWFGRAYLSMSKEVAKEVGQSLIAAALEVEEGKGE